MKADENVLVIVCRSVRSYCLDNRVDEAALDDDVLADTSFADLKMDSMEKLELVLGLEEDFKIALDEGAVQNCKTAGELARLIAAQIVS